MAAGPTLLQRIWDMLDAELDAIVANQFGDEQEIQKHKIRGRAIAEVLAMFMVPHFESADEIAKEAQRRRNARLNGDTAYETAGLGSRAYEPPPGAPVRSTAPSTAPTRRSSAKRTTPKTPVPSGKLIPDSALNSARTGIESGMFTPDQIGQMYGMTAAEVKTQLGLA